MAHPEFEKNLAKAELIQELTEKVDDQLTGRMDGIRARAYWESRLPEIMHNPSMLAEALTYALHRRKQAI